MSDYNYTDSTNNSIKDQEIKNKKYSEEYYNDINISKINYKSENEEFISPENKINWNITLQNTYHFSHDIERVWSIIRNFELLTILSNEGHFPCINIKGKDTWTKGNIFKGNFYKFCPYIAKVEKTVNLPETKVIKWMFKSIEDKCYFSMKFSLYKVTQDYSTVLLRKIKFEKKLTNFEEKSNDIKSNKIFKSIDDLLENETISLLKYESGIIKGKMEDIYNIISDSNKLTAIAPNNYIIPNIKIKDLKIGEKKQVSIIKNEKVIKFDIVLKCKEINPGWNKWNIALEASGGEPKKIPKHCSLLQLTKINNDECQLILLTKFFEPINCQEYNEYTLKKKYLILSLKDYFENFYSPESSNYI